MCGVGGKDITTLRYFGIYGSQHFSHNYDYTSSYSMGTERSSVTDITPLSKLSVNTKKSIKHLFLNNNNIKNIDNLYEFENVENLRLEGNKIASLSGLYNNTTNTGMKNLTYLWVSYNNLGKDIEGAEMSPGTDSLSCLAITSVDENEKYTFAKRFTKLSKLDLEHNESLKWIDYLKPYKSLSLLYLGGCSNLTNAGIVQAGDAITSASLLTLDEDYRFYLATVDNNIKTLDLSRKDYDAK